MRLMSCHSRINHRHRPIALMKKGNRILCLTVVTTIIVVFSYYNDNPMPPTSAPDVHADSPGPSTKEITPIVSFSTLRRNAARPTTAASREEAIQMERKIQLFHVKITEKERHVFEVLLKTFLKAVPVNVTYFLYSGSLLGSYRHHGMIPWDDDLDLVVRADDKPALFTSLSTQAPDFIINRHGVRRWKFYNQESQPVPNRSWRWPSLDISFFTDNGTHVLDVDAAMFSKFVYKRTDVFPLCRRPFMGLLLPTPRNTESIILHHYSLSICQNTPTDHKFGAGIPMNKRTILPCNKLKAIYPFVRREYSSNGTLEILERNTTRIGSYFIPGRD
ncbi:uncharacterized protein [Haliotis cracherodii]|uniref:uncharacterized protein n=1 Tax=Haliotis cracherodii TaxID=6455 RepID=UPI0039E8DE9D